MRYYKTLNIEPLPTREEAIAPFALRYVIPDRTLIYSTLSLTTPAIVRAAPNGQPTRVLRVLCLTLPVSPEDAWLYEQNVTTDEIFYFLLAGEPRPPLPGQPPTPEQWRSLLIQRLRL